MSTRSIHLMDRDELLRNIEADIDISVTGARNMEAVKCCLQNILDDVKESPVVDAVEVVRCKDCKYWLPHSQFGFDEDNEEYYDYCELLVPDDDYYAITRQADDFCSRAERKKNVGR